MRNTFILFMCLLPGLLIAQSTPYKYVPPPSRDTTKSEAPEEEAVQPQPKKVKKSSPEIEGQPAPYDWKRNGFFHALFHVGVNFAQIDGDAYAGFNKPGFDGGAGVLVRFHKYLSTSVELNYSQWGARYSFSDKINMYNANVNYIQIPLSINVQDKEIIMFSAGLNAGFLAGYKERNEVGQNITDTVQPQPRKFDLDGFGMLHIIIKKQFAFGVKYSYSILPFRGVEDRYINLSKVKGEYNNVITIRLMYILSAWKTK